MLRLMRLPGRATTPWSMLQHQRSGQLIISRGFHASRGCLDTQKPEPPSGPSKDQDPVSFRLSLYQSTFDRIQREKADNERFAKIRRENDRDRLGLSVSLVLRRCYS